ncbi:hypothetical protein BJY04DRAFT_24669 [Aspergillus karnatakaensis]|uniref:uncharacterized protein n=1 Tax=Aspergillus karnatakaensis TaxID=1810916 RepID=UPI003CCD2DDA
MSSPEFDADLCATLYNRIIQIGFEGSCLAETGHSLTTNWFDAFRDHPQAVKCRNLFPPSLITFLEHVNVILDRAGQPLAADALVHHLQPLSTPAKMLAIKAYTNQLEPEDCIILFPNHIFEEDDCAGVIMDLEDLTVCYRVDTSAINEPHSEEITWYPLEELLVRLNCIIQIGKYIPVPFGSAKCHPSASNNQRWDVIPWNDFILTQTINAWNALVDSISSRLPEPAAAAAAANNQPIAPTTLDPRIQGFPRAFLQKSRNPPFKYIAPGLTIYNTTTPPPIPRQNPQTLRYDSPNPDMSYTLFFHDALILFPEEGHEASESGLWICPDEGWADTVRLALPYRLKGCPDYRGKHVTRGLLHGSELWQHGECPFFVHHGTGLATILRQWQRLVEDGSWVVGRNGVEGGVDFYRQAEDEGNAEMFCLRDDCFDLGEVEISLD